MSDFDDDMIQTYGEDTNLVAITVKEGEDRVTIPLFIDEQAGTAFVLDVTLSVDVMAATLRAYRDGDFCGEERLDVSR